jgi:hypothetical protein
MQDCSPLGRFPEEEIAPMKVCANNLIVDKFRRAGLGRGGGKTVLILDTPLLRTTKILFEQFSIGIKRLIIVEANSDTADEMHRAILTQGLDVMPIEIINAEVVNWLRESDEMIDFIWLDIQKDRFELAHVIDHHLRNAKCFAVTIAGRSRAHGSIADRVNNITRGVEHTLPHKVIDFGYKLSEHHQSMQLIAYSKFYSSCMYRMIQRSDGTIGIAGYPDRRARRVIRICRATRTSPRRAQF